MSDVEGSKRNRGSEDDSTELDKSVEEFRRILGVSQDRDKCTISIHYHIFPFQTYKRIKNDLNHKETEILKLKAERDAAKEERDAAVARAEEYEKNKLKILSLLGNGPSEVRLTRDQAISKQHLTLAL